LGPRHWRNCDEDLSGPDFVILQSGLEKVRRDIRILKGERTEFVKMICPTMQLINLNAPSRAGSDGASATFNIAAHVGILLFPFIDVFSILFLRQLFLSTFIDRVLQCSEAN
jgi:hypothetical protein